MDESILTERQRRCIPDVTFELIPIKNLVSNQDYQRPPQITPQKPRLHGLLAAQSR